MFSSHTLQCHWVFELFIDLNVLCVTPQHLTWKNILHVSQLMTFRWFGNFFRQLPHSLCLVEFFTLLLDLELSPISSVWNVKFNGMLILISSSQGLQRHWELELFIDLNFLCVTPQHLTWKNYLHLSQLIILRCFGNDLLHCPHFTSNNDIYFKDEGKITL